MIKTKEKIIIIMTMIITVLSIMTIPSYALDNTLTMVLDSDKTEIKAGETVTILVKVKDIQGDGIALFNGNIEYDANIFECTVSGDDAGIWQKQALIENSLTMVRADLETNKENQTIAKIVLKAKSNVSIGSQIFKISKIEFSTGNIGFSIADVSKSVKIVEESKEENNTNINTNTNTNTSNSNNGAGTINKNNSSISENSNLATEKTLPKAGVKNVLIIGIVILATVGCVYYYKYKRIC